jgi:hypothetical protein
MVAASTDGTYMLDIAFVTGLLLVFGVLYGFCHACSRL